MRPSDPTLAIRLESNIGTANGVFRGHLSRAGELDDRRGPDNRVQGVHLNLSFRTEGRGDTDSSTVSSLEFPVDQYGRMSADFSLPVPPQVPISYDGRLIRIMYQIEARVRIKLGFDPKIEVPVLVIPANGWGLYQRPHPLPPVSGRVS